MAVRDLRQRLGQELRILREGAGKSGRELAAELGWSQAKISRMETGSTRVVVADVEKFLAGVGASPADRERVLALAEKAASVRSSYQSEYRWGPAERRNLAGLLKSTEQILIYQPVFVPEPLQTPEYARQALGLRGLGEKQVDARLMGQLDWQRALFAREGPRYRFLIAEAALRWRPGDWSMLKAQLHRLCSLAELPRVTVQVISWAVEVGGYAAMGFTGYYPRCCREPPTVLMQTVTDELRVGSDELGGRYRTTFEQMTKAALSPEATITFVQELADTLID